MLATGTLAFLGGLLLAPVLSRGNPGLADDYRIAFGICIVTYVGIAYTYSLQPRHLLWWNLVCRLLLEKKKTKIFSSITIRLPTYIYVFVDSFLRHPTAP